MAPARISGHVHVAAEAFGHERAAHLVAGRGNPDRAEHRAPAVVPRRNSLCCGLEPDGARGAVDLVDPGRSGSGSCSVAVRSVLVSPPKNGIVRTRPSRGPARARRNAPPARRPARRPPRRTGRSGRSRTASRPCSTCRGAALPPQNASSVHSRSSVPGMTGGSARPRRTCMRLLARRGNSTTPSLALPVSLIVTQANGGRQVGHRVRRATAWCARSPGSGCRPRAGTPRSPPAIRP